MTYHRISNICFKPKENQEFNNRKFWFQWWYLNCLDINLYIFYRLQSPFNTKTQHGYFQVNGYKRTKVQTMMIYISLKRYDNNSQRSKGMKKFCKQSFFPFITNLFPYFKEELRNLFSKRPLNVHFFFEDCYNLFCDKIWMAVPFI